MLKLSCYVRHDNPNEAFEVKIGNDESVAALKEAIMAKISQTFHGVDADFLVLWASSIPYNANLKETVQRLNLDYDKALNPMDSLADIFPSDLERKSIHIVVDSPPSVQAISSGPQLLQLNCLVSGDDRSHIFPVKILPTETIGTLKNIIKMAKQPSFNHIPADALVLWGISMPANETLEEELSKLELIEERSLLPWDRLSKVFSGVPEEGHLHVVVKYRIVAEIPVRTRTLENKAQIPIAAPSLKRTLDTISIDRFLEILRPKIKNFLSNRRLPVWMPPETVNSNIRQFYHNLAIPSTNENRPNLLLHNLGNDSNPNVDALFRSGTHHRILCNTSGAGKTALIFNGLCTHWGFYFAAEQDTNNIGAKDLQLSIDMMSVTPGWTDDVFVNPMPDAFRAATSINEKIAFKRVYKVLLTRWIIFRVFIEVAKEQNGGALPRGIKEDWLIFQVLPVVLINELHPFLAFLNFCLVDISTEELLNMLFTFSPGKILGSDYNAESDLFFYVLDEAQVVGERYMGAFADVNAEIRRPVLRPIIRAWQSAAPPESIRFIVSGTGFSLSLFKTVLSSGVGKASHAWSIVRKTGDFISRALQQSYISRYLPPTFLSSRSGAVLAARLYEWLRGRHRFTASFLERLLMGDWTADGPSSPHKLLNAYVRLFTEFTPIDGDHTLLAVEPEVHPPELQGFSWVKLKRDKNLLQELSTSLYTYVTRGKFPMWYKDRQDLVEYGVARFMGEGEDVIIEEPMALVGILRYFETEGLTMEGDIRARMQSAKGSAFEEAVLLSCTRLFRVGARLSDVFQFYGEVPEWGNQMAHIVSQKGQELEVSDIINGNPILPSAGVAYYAKDPNDVKEWIESKQSAWCIPGELMGPDLMAWLQLEDGNLLLLLIQAKCHLEGNIDTHTARVTAKAIRCLSPNRYYASLNRQSAKDEISHMLEAINEAGECFTGAQYNILRVIAAYPLDAHIDMKSSSEVRAALEGDQHPLATLRHSPLLASLATCDSMPTILSSLEHSLKRVRDEDSIEDHIRESKLRKTFPK